MKITRTMVLSRIPARPTPWALSLTGSGHLLIYQLGVCQRLFEATKVTTDSTTTNSAVAMTNVPRIQTVIGSSGGAIVAAVLVLAPHRIVDYAQQFIAQRGRGIDLLRDILSSSRSKHMNTSNTISLNICTTNCRTGKEHIFTFENHVDNDLDVDYVIQCIRASCSIPPSFHPWDVLSRTQSIYPEHEGILIDEDYYVDGGIAAPAPPTPKHFQRLIISPISGPMRRNCHRISPLDNSLRIGKADIPHEFGVYFSVANLQSMIASSGLVNSTSLENWFNRGQEDATKFLDQQCMSTKD